MGRPLKASSFILKCWPSRKKREWRWRTRPIVAASRIIRGARGHLLLRFPDLKLSCDLSHWVCITERLLTSEGEIIVLAAEHCLHGHARVGYENGPQVADPRDRSSPFSLPRTRLGGT